MSVKQNKVPVLFLGTQMEVAGAQRVLLSLANCFYQKGYPVQAVFFYDKQGLTKTWQAQYDFPILSLGGWRTRTFSLFNFFILGRGLLRLFWILRRRVKLIITFTPHSNLLGLPIAWLARVPVRIGTHHGYIEGSSNRLARLHGWLTNSPICNMMVAVSEQVRKFALDREGAESRKLIVIENGIEPLRIQRLNEVQKRSLRAEIEVPEKTALLLTVGRLTVQKGHTVLLDAIVRLKPRETTPIFAFVGEGPLRYELEQKARNLGIDKQICFLGIRSDVNELLLSADIFVQPSLWEGLSIALLEALRAGLPVVATRVEGVVDIVEDGRSALVVPPNDSRALTVALERLLDDPGFRERLGQAGQQRAQTHYSVERMCKGYENLFLALLKNESQTEKEK